jgi:hypothetical protein
MCKTCGATGYELRRRIASNGTTHVGYQCLTCGRSAGNWLPHSSVKNIDRLPVFDMEVYERWTQTQIEGYRLRAQRSADFFESKEWRELRYRVLTTQGAECMACHRKNCELHVDHIKPRSKFPELALEITNLQVLCADCNLGKGAWDQTDWRRPVNGEARP